MYIERPLFSTVEYLYKSSVSDAEDFELHNRLAVEWPNRLSITHIGRDERGLIVSTSFSDRRHWKSKKSRLHLVCRCVYELAEEQVPLIGLAMCRESSQAIQYFERQVEG